MYSSDTCMIPMVEVRNGDRLQDFVENVDGVSVVMFTIVKVPTTISDRVREVCIWHAPRDPKFKVFLAGDRTVGEALMVVGYNQDHFDIYHVPYISGEPKIISPLTRVSTIFSGDRLMLGTHFERSREEIDARMGILMGDPCADSSGSAQGSTTMYPP